LSSKGPLRAEIHPLRRGKDGLGPGRDMGQKEEQKADCEDKGTQQAMGHRGELGEGVSGKN